MAYVRITRAPNVESKYGLEDGQIKIAYAHAAEKTKANQQDKEVWVATEVRGERVKLFRGEYEWERNE